MKGFVDFAKSERGFGYAYDMEKRTRYFFRITNVQSGVMPQVGNLIEFTPGVTLKGPVALNISVLDAETVATMLSLGSKS